jgi:hypothetical protein
MSKKFYEKRTYTKGDMTVQVGVRANEPAIRVFLPDMQAASLTIQRADDLADLLDEALDGLDEEPLS